MLTENNSCPSRTEFSKIISISWIMIWKLEPKPFLMEPKPFFESYFLDSMVFFLILWCFCWYDLKFPLLPFIFSNSLMRSSNARYSWFDEISFSYHVSFTTLGTVQLRCQANNPNLSFFWFCYKKLRKLWPFYEIIEPTTAIFRILSISDVFGTIPMHISIKQ